jgi:alkyl sulfatase BDS1-like metallo-beta-lactamase superfamily hydrolase
VTGVVFTHSHVDHFGGVKGVTSQQEVDAGTCPILAPIGFLEHAIEENVYAGTAMGRPARPQRSARCRVDLRRGDPAILAKLTGLLDSNDPDFSIVTP